MTAREGLPPCIVRAAVFDGRQATWHHGAACEHPHNTHYVVVGDVSTKTSKWSSLLHKIIPETGTRMTTDDPAEAEAAYERAEVYVRTGELP